MPRSPIDVSDATLTVHLTPGIGPVTCKRLRDHFGSDEAVVAADINALQTVEGIGRKTAEALRRGMDRADPVRERALMSEFDATIICVDDVGYPPLMVHLDDAPAALWVRGELTCHDKAVAIVGSRRCTAYGREQAAVLAQRLAEAGLTLVSGGAIGIDAEAHRGALRAGGPTVVVQGCGLQHIYPSEHADLFDRIVAAGGAIVSEYPMSVAPRREHFPRRNRIISGMSLGVIVVEAGRRSGALITARQAIDQGREVFALPGRVDSPASAGCLELFKAGEAALITNHTDVITGLDAAGMLRCEGLTVHDDGGASPLTVHLTSVQRRIVSALASRDDELSPDQISAVAQIPMHTLLAELTLLQLQRVIRRSHQGVRLTAFGQNVAGGLCNR